MSEFQYYEWQAIDRPLTGAEMREVGRLSSHMDLVTPTQAVVTYEWGDFKHDPTEVLLRYFDAFLYWANWGSRSLAFRFPKGAIDVEGVNAYWVDDELTLRERGDHLLLDLDMGYLEPGDWYEEPPGLGSLLPLRQQIIEGEYRVLYLAWLRAAQQAENVDPDDPEPPVPAGLKELDASLEAFARTFLELDPYLLEAAAAASDRLQPAADEALAAALARLPAEECRAYLLGVLRSEPRVRSSLRKRLAGMAGLGAAPGPGRRTVGQLLEEAERLRQEDRLRRQEAEEQRRRQELENLARRQDSLWLEVEGQIQRGQPYAYEKAAELLKRLREVAEYQGRLPDFQARVAELRSRYSRRPSLMACLNAAGL
ncbi:MAG: hypothetical protein QME94_15055 [Anaerolineae bacterium]|nr:hypothetical protein [Anaerolineae bacterium]